MLLYNIFVSFFFLTAVTFVSGGHSPHGEEALTSLSETYGPFSDDIKEDAKLDVIGLLTKYGYSSEAHEVGTEDGYLLTVHRISGRKGETSLHNGKSGKPVVFLMHGLLSSSADWVNTGPHNDALGYVLANEGYDVWMGNARGNYYSRKHKSMSPNESAFWKFSWNEIGVYDLAAMIDYALEVTGQEKLHYIGHSQGTTSFFVLMSERPEYNEKIILMQALAPAVYMTHMKNPIVRALGPYINSIHAMTLLLGKNEFGASRKFYELAGELICHDDSFLQPLCSNAFFIFGGFNKELFNTTLMPVILGHTPAGASSRQLIHYGQEFKSGKFRKFDFGRIGNLLQYSQRSPPDYKIDLITAPVAIYYGDNDWLTDPIDIKRLHEELSNSVGLFRVDHPKFTHLDFLWAIGIKSLLYDHVVKLLKEYN